MNIQTYKVEKYKDCPVYFRSFSTHFEYLTVIKGELYTAHIRVKPTIINRLLYWLKIEKTLYSQRQQRLIIAQVRKMAEATIDFILKGNV